MFQKSVYLAAPFTAREAAKAARAALAARGIDCTSRWIDSHLSDLDDLSDEVREREATADLQDVQRADAFVLLTGHGPSTSGGMHLEMGYAIACRKPLWIVGPRTSVFHYFREIFQVDSVNAVSL